MRRSRPRRRAFSLKAFARQIVAIAVLSVGLLLAAAFAGVAVQANAVARDGAAVRAGIAQLDAEVAAKREAAAVKQTDQYLVDKARDYGYVRPGEALVNVQVDGGSARSVVAKVAPDAIVARVGRWIALFFR